MGLETVFDGIVNHYSSDPMRVVGLIAWILSWRAAYLMSCNPNAGFLAHVLYTVANVLLFVFNLYYGHIELVLMATTFLFTSVKGCFTYGRRRRVQSGVESLSVPIRN